MCAVKVNETKLTTRSVFIVDLVVLGGKKESKYGKRTFFSELPAASWPVSKPLASEGSI